MTPFSYIPTTHPVGLKKGLSTGLGPPSTVLRPYAQGNTPLPPLGIWVSRTYVSPLYMYATPHIATC